MYHIVIPVDEDEDRAVAAVQFVTSLGDESGLDIDLDAVSVSVLNVFEEFKAIDDGGNVSSKDIYDEDEFPDSVLTVRDRLTDAGISVDLVRRHGKPGEEIVEFADSIDADNIVVPGRKRSPVGKAVFGSVTQDIILNTERPVTIV